ncbi:SDR family NAD(P)-dependent oxidoreductase [Dactylosporangium sp. CS-033363]|uniref:SDR family NAD(P)-dependent oxidoreductase n=1 Tax=Dactylosporangium sp. CS-033363 TaxID=3239935 RepID=UPI003D93B9F0
MRDIVITGGATGIGFAVAAAFVQAGDRVTITGRRPDVLAEAADRLGARAVAFDASDPAAVQAALPHLPSEIHVLVNNAGGNTDFTAPEPAEDDLAGLAAQYQANMTANLIGPVLMTAALAPRLADDGRVVTIGSIAARRGAGSYGAAKAAVEAWTASVASKLGPRGITANVVSPGLTVQTDYFRGGLSDTRRDRMVAETLTKRPGEPDDIAATVVFLASLGARHITGQTIHVNGGAYLGR